MYELFSKVWIQKARTSNELIKLTREPADQEIAEITNILFDIDGTIGYVLRIPGDPNLLWVKVKQGDEFRYMEPYYEVEKEVLTADEKSSKKAVYTCKDCIYFKQSKNLNYGKCEANVPHWVYQIDTNYTADFIEPNEYSSEVCDCFKLK